MRESALLTKYTQTVDRESAFEMLAKRAEEAAKPAESGGIGGWLADFSGGGDAAPTTGGRGAPRAPTTAPSLGEEDRDFCCALGCDLRGPSDRHRHRARRARSLLGGRR